MEPCSQWEILERKCKKIWRKRFLFNKVINYIKSIIKSINFNNNFKRKLVEFLSSPNKKNVAIACYDLGEFCRFHTWGRKIIENFDDGKKKTNVKTVIMELAKI